MLLLEETERNIDEALTEGIENMWICFTAYISISYVVSLRGSEGLLLDMNGLMKHWKRNDGTYFLIPLLGRIKGEEVERPHLIPCVNTTSTQIRIKEVVRRLMKLKLKQGIITGPAISDCQGKSLTTSEFDDMMTEILENIFGHKPELFPPHILSKEHISERYHCFRTLRRTSDTRAIEMNLKTTDIDIVNKWRQAGKRSSQPMKQYYAQIELLMGPFKRYTKAM